MPSTDATLSKLSSPSNFILISYNDKILLEAALIQKATLTSDMAAQAVNAANPLKILQEGYKDQKEAFVSGLVGGSITEINYVTAVGTVRYLLSRSPDSD